MSGTLGFPAIGRLKNLAFAIGIDTIGSGTWLPVSVLYFLHTTSLSLFEIGLAISIASVVSLPATVIVGHAVDRYGAKNVMQAGNVLQFVGFALHPFATSFLGAVVAIGCTAVGRSAFWGSYGPIIGSVSPSVDRERWFGLLGSMRNTGFALGCLLSAAVTTLDSVLVYQSAVVLNAFTFLAAFLFMARVNVPPVSAPAESPLGGWRRVLVDRGYRWLIGAGFCYAMTTMVLTVVIPVYVVEVLGLPGWVSGAFFIVNTVMVSAGQGLAVSAMAGTVRTRVVMLGIACSVASYVVLSTASLTGLFASASLVLAAGLLYTLGELITDPVLEALSVDAAPEEHRGRYVAVYQLSWAIAYAVAPGLYAWLLGFGDQAIWAAAGLVGALGAACCVRMRHSLPLAGMRVAASAVREAD